MKMDCNNLFPNYGHITDKFEFWIWLGVKFVLDNWSSLPQPKVDHDICCSVRLLTLKVKTMICFLSDDLCFGWMISDRNI
jgi:hypothetical protein